MTQDQRWKAKYDEIMAFMAQNHRWPSKYYAEERNNWNWMRHQQKLMGKGEMKEERIEGGDRGQVPVPSFISSKLHKMPLFQQKRGQAV